MQVIWCGGKGVRERLDVGYLVWRERVKGEVEYRLFFLVGKGYGRS